MIIGVTGTLGAGKGEVVSCLVRKNGFVHYSVRTFLAEEMVKENIIINRDNMVAYANKLREKHGAHYVFDQLYQKAKKEDKPAVIESIRTVGEAEALKEKGGILIAVDADEKKRYDRIYGRRSALDHVSFEKFQEQESLEMHSNDAYKQNIGTVMLMADYTIENNGTLEEFQAEVERVLQKIESR